MPTIYCEFQSIGAPERGASLLLPASISSLCDALDQARLPRNSSMKSIKITKVADLETMKLLTWIPPDITIEALQYIAQSMEYLGNSGNLHPFLKRMSFEKPPVQMPRIAAALRSFGITTPSPILPVLDVDKYESVFFVELAGGETSMTLELPSNGEAMEQVYKTLGRDNAEECIQLVRCHAIPTLDRLQGEFTLDDLNHLAQTIQDLERSGRLPVYKALLEKYEGESESSLMELAERVDYYEFHPDIDTPAELARSYLHYRYAIQDITFYETTDLLAYGERLMERYEYTATSYGYLRNMGGEDPILPFVSAARPAAEEKSQALT